MKGLDSTARRNAVRIKEGTGDTYTAEQEAVPSKWKPTAKLEPAQ